MMNRPMGIWGWAAALLFCLSLAGCDKLDNGKEGKAKPPATSGAEQPTAKEVTPPATLKKSLFELSEADLGAVPKMAKDAVERLDLEGGKLTHVMLQRHLRLANQVQFRVYIQCTRTNASVSYDSKGTFKKVWK